jgi:hypothetical protein
MVFQVYVDESGMHSRDGYVCVAGYAGTSEQWATFGEHLSGVLRRNGIEYFHAKNNRCDSLVGEMEACIRQSGVIGFATVMNAATYTRVASAFVKSVHGNAYAACATAFASWVSGMLDRANSVGEFVFESGAAGASRVNEILAYGVSVRQRGLSSVSFVPKRSAIPLQAADFLAHAVAQCHGEFVESAPPAPNILCVQLLSEELIQILNVEWEKRAKKRRRQKADERRQLKYDTAFIREMHNMIYEWKARGMDIHVVDGSLLRKYPDVGIGVVVALRSGELIAVPNTPEAWSDLRDIDAGKWKKIV